MWLRWASNINTTRSFETLIENPRHVLVTPHKKSNTVFPHRQMMEGSNSWGQRSKTGQLSPGCRKTTKTSVKLFNSLKTIKTNLKLSWESIYNIALKPELNWPQQVWQTTFDLYTLKHNAACSAAPRRVITPSERRPLTATSTQLLGGFVKHMGWTNQCRLRNRCGRGLDVATSERSACLSGDQHGGSSSGSYSCCSLFH